MRNSGSSYTTSTVHESPFGGVNEWGMFVAALTFTPSPYILLQLVTSTPIYTIEATILLGKLRSQWKARYHFFEGIQNNFINCGL
jgi:uncharacterized membrane protein